MLWRGHIWLRCFPCFACALILHLHGGLVVQLSEGHFLLKMNGSYRIFEALVGSLNSGMNWLPKLKAFSSRVHLVDKLGISPLFLFLPKSER